MHDEVVRLIVRPNLPIIEAVDVLNREHKGIVFVADDDGVLAGIVTDSDIRRAVLNRVGMDRPIRDIMVTRPVTVGPDAKPSEVLEVMERRQVYQIPVLDAAGRILGIHLIENLLHLRSKRTQATAVVMAGGLGTRLRPLTDDKPKPLLSVGDTPILFIILDQLIEAGFERIFITLNYKGEMIEREVGRHPKYRDAVEFVRENERLGTAGALSLLPARPDESFLVINGDLLTTIALRELMRYHAFENNVATMAVKEHRYQIPYGIVDLDGTRISRITEKPIRTAFLNTGVYVLEPEVLDRIAKHRSSDMPEVISLLIDEGARVGGFPIHEYWTDIGQLSQLQKAETDVVTLFPTLTLAERKNDQS